jgi:hypothetical protein
MRTLKSAFRITAVIELATADASADLIDTCVACLCGWRCDAPGVARKVAPDAPPLHGLWNRSRHTGHTVARLRFWDRNPTGVYHVSFFGFVTSDQTVCARPVRPTATHDRALLVSEDGGSEIWRVSYRATQ